MIYFTRQSHAFLSSNPLYGAISSWQSILITFVSVLLSPLQLEQSRPFLEWYLISVACHIYTGNHLACFVSLAQTTPIYPEHWLLLLFVVANVVSHIVVGNHLISNRWFEWNNVHLLDFQSKYPLQRFGEWLAQPSLDWDTCFGGQRIIQTENSFGIRIVSKSKWEPFRLIEWGTVENGTPIAIVCVYSQSCVFISVKAPVFFTNSMN